MTDRLPDPLVPPEVDLRGYEFMPLFGDRLFTSPHWICSSARAKVGALQLWYAAYAKEAPASSLPDDDSVLAHYASVGVAVWRRIRPQAMHGFVLCNDTRWYHPFIAALALRAWQKRISRAALLNRRTMMENGEWDALRAAVFERDDYTCVYCHAYGVRLECDHVVPLIRGGETVISNLATACLPCNRKKGSKTPEEWLH